MEPRIWYRGNSKGTTQIHGVLVWIRFDTFSFLHFHCFPKKYHRSAMKTSCWPCHAGIYDISSELLCVTGLCVGNSPGTSEFPAQRASNAEIKKLETILQRKYFGMALPLGQNITTIQTNNYTILSLLTHLKSWKCMGMYPTMFLLMLCCWSTMPSVSTVLTKYRV